MLYEEQEARRVLSDRDRLEYEKMIRAAKQMGEAIERVREATRPLSPRLETCDLREIVIGCTVGNHSFCQRAKEREIHDIIDYPDGLIPQHVVCDRNLIEEAISNLVDNALYFVPRGGKDSKSL